MELAKVFPFISQLRGYNKVWFKSDLIAGLTVGAILIPQAMAYAALAGVQPVYGLYASLVPIVIYALLASSTKLSVGPVAVSALLVYAGISQIATPGTEEFLAMIITAGLLIGILQLALGVARLGFLVNFLSHPVIAGFTSAAAVIIILSQVKDALGLSFSQAHGSLETLKSTIENIHHTNVTTALITVLSIVAMLTLKKISKKIPGALLIVSLGIGLSYALDLNQYGVAIIGEIPSGLPTFKFPSFDISKLNLLFPTVLSVTVIGIVESIGIAKALEAKHKDHQVNPDQELIALGLAKVGGAFFQAIPISGSFSRSAINSESDAKTTLSSLISVVLIVMSLLFLTDIFYYLPKAVLSAIILLAVINLFDIKEAKHLWKTDRKDLVMMLVTFVFTLFLGMELGVLSGVVLSILHVLYSSSRPNVVELGNISGTAHYKDLERYDQAKRNAEMLIIRFDHQLYFGNASFFKEWIYEYVNQHGNDIKHIILDASHIDSIDSTGIHVLKDLDIDLKSRGIALHLCEASGPLRDSLFKSDLLGEYDKHHLSVHTAVTTIKEQLARSSKIISRAADPLQTNKDL